MNIKQLCFSICLGLGLLGTSMAQSFATAFTYQGHLEKTNIPMDASTCFKFALFDAPTAGNQVGTTLEPCGVLVDDGRFSLSLNFGAGAFNGSPRWLEVQVQSDPGSAMTTLSPRQLITPAPTAIFAQTAGEATTATVALSAATATESETAANGVPSGFSILGKSSTPPTGFTWSGAVVDLKQPANTWKSGPDLPFWVPDPVGGVIDGKLYVAGSDTYAYDPAANTWVSKTDMPFNYTNAAGAVANGKLYSFGGQTGSGASNTIVSYDPQTDVWLTGTPAPMGVSRNCAAAWENKVYFFGGDSESVSGITDVLVYDTQADAWTAGAPMLTGRRYATAVACEGKIHVFGGDGGGTVRYKHEIYDVETNTWSSAVDMPEPTAYASGVLSNGMIHLFGGEIDNDYLSSHRIYDPVSESWTTEAPMPIYRKLSLAAAVGSDLILAGGLAKETLYYAETGDSMIILEGGNRPSRLYVHVKE